MKEIREIKLETSADKDGVKYYAIVFFAMFEKTPKTVHINTSMMTSEIVKEFLGLVEWML